jgi:predicted nucleotide-binding protein (sugar kinase/HSP70/actin superfamily)
MLGQPTTAVQSVRLRTRTEIEDEIQRRVQAERLRLQQVATASVRHFERPVERAFTAEDRDRVTILFGGLTWKHEWLLRSVFESSGYRIELMPVPDVAAFQLGKEFGNNGQCNPTYFMVGHLIKHLQLLERQGLSRQEIVDNYVFVTAGSCGPCRFGMYEAEYRLAVQNAGYDGFRILIIQQNQGVNAQTPAPGLELDTDFRLGTIAALDLGDVLNDVAFQLRPFEVTPGSTDRVFNELMQELSHSVRTRRRFEIDERAPAWVRRWLDAAPGFKAAVNVAGKTYDQLYGPQTRDAMRAARERLATVEVDRLRVKPVVKITGEFFAQTTEGDGNFRMFQFLEREGAQVIVEPVANWIAYLSWVAKAQMRRKKDADDLDRPRWWQVHRHLARELAYRKSLALFATVDWVFAHEYQRMVRALGNLAHPLLDMEHLAELSRPYYHGLARGGEGHLEVAKNIYYTVNKKAHMVLSLKPFGCMPSSQSDGVQSAVMSHFKDMIYLPIETSGEGEVNAHSRVQMALGEAKAKAKLEFQQVLDSTGKRLDDVRAYVAEHAVLRHPFYPVPHRHGVTGTAANFVAHVSDLMDGRTKLRRVPGERGTPSSGVGTALGRAAAL